MVKNYLMKKVLPCGPINSVTEMFEDPQTIATKNDRRCKK